MATVTLTGKNSAEVRRWAKAVLQVVAEYDDNRVVGTLTATDAAPMVVSGSTPTGTTITVTV
jgi:hypothetical protein